MERAAMACMEDYLDNGSPVDTVKTIKAKHFAEALQKVTPFVSKQERHHSSRWILGSHLLGANGTSGYLGGLSGKCVYLGSRNSGRCQRSLKGSIPEEISRPVDSKILNGYVMHKHLVSWIRNWFTLYSDVLNF
ncbi:hypothetical protein Droror1_Dr00019161 [Drosera rotundifolia]